MKYICRIVASTLIVMSVLSLGFGMSALVYADPFSGGQSAACTGVGLGTNGCGTAASSASTISTTITDVIDVLTIVVGLASVIVLIICGFRLIVSGGDSQGVASAKNGILYAIIGLVVVALAQVIVHFVIGKVTS